MILAFQNRKKIAAFAQGCAATWVDLAGINTKNVVGPGLGYCKYSTNRWYIAPLRLSLSVQCAALRS
jgi:hypothetical protein